MNSTVKKGDNLPATQEKKPTLQEAQEALNEIFLRGESKSGITEQEALEILTSTPTSAMEEMTSEYFDFSKKGEYNLIVIGLSKMNTTDREGKAKEVEVVELKDGKNQKFIAGASVLVNTVKRFKKLPAFIRVITTGEKTGDKGREYYEMRILTFAQQNED